ncbi:iron ABC transporter substrate-binding protein [Aureimonas endophytica]|uniref:Iron ABC transporter substrate-binding protein n=1 Tax=Aureimonas endophytica TaxID=2027858 RepID=A0A917E3H5_9HYPH|nr:iron ABC transporter substrate-binding protein [Aureimonas endophytica]GGD97914.1 iron ABC transporter substrate-binding protein [Aureimonas endophytica]
MKLRKLGLTGALALATSVAALIGGRAFAEEGITVYNAQHESLTKAWAEGFTKETGIPVTLRKGSDTELGNQIVQEGANSPADVFVTENSPAMALVDRAGLFAPLSQETLSEVPEQFRPVDGHWLGVAARSTVFVYDKRKLKEADLPKSILDLAGDSWKGRWAASPTGADFQAIVAAMLELKGEAATLDWLKAMKANAKPYKGNSVAMKAVNAGEAEGAVIYHYYYFGDQAKTGENSANVAQHYFRNQDPGAFVSVSGAGVLASSKKKAEAEAFVKWVAGPKGQEILKTGTSFEYAIGNGAASHPALVPLAELQAPKVSPDKLDNRKVVELMTAAGLL